MLIFPPIFMDAGEEGVSSIIIDNKVLVFQLRKPLPLHIQIAIIKLSGPKESSSE